jgi:hypothetical protein
MDHHPIHVHGNQFYVTGTEGGRIPQSAWYPGNTVLVGVAQARDIEFDAVYAGDWMLHCHLPHHMMNQMISMVGPMSHGGHELEPGAAPSREDKKRVPGYPQDDLMMTMFMDKEVAKPETMGLAPGWSAALQGMMSLVRVLPPDKYEQVMTAIREKRVEQPKSPPAHKHHDD